ncbi:MAG TPA: DUF4038 domain-containing protein [Candidatus Sulfopaludibacter sp.]|nr:DUF4038 domain-containing protein [Candidatus Sulfopaludibacter sp.]
MRQLRFIVIGLCLCGTVFAATYPVKISSSNPRLLVDQNNIPFLMVGDSPQSLIVNLSLTSATSYLTDRATNGFNTVLVDAICTVYTGGPANASLLNGTLPFTNTLASGYYDLTAPNSVYFSYVDQIINLCASNGIVVMVNPIETGGWLPTMLANGTNGCRAYGQYLGDRYKNFPNIIWSSGNDFQNWLVSANDAVVTAVALGIRDKDTNHLQTVELGYFLSSSLDDTNWAPLVGLNAAYTYSPTYAEVLHAYNQSNAVPAFMIEANYEYETNTGTDGGSTRNLRMQEYWTMLSGAVGQLYGNHFTVRFSPGWQSYLDSPGVAQLGYLTNLFGSREWYNLVPDQTHTFVTGGYGSFTNGIPGGGSGQGINVLFTGNNFVTAALTPDGSLGMAYLPQGGTITVAMTSLQNNISARWFDPSANSFRTIAGSPFSNTGTQNFTSPGSNSAGDPDWVLLLESAVDPQALSIFLTATNTVIVTWPSAWSGYTVQQNSDLTTTNWVNVTNASSIVGSEWQSVFMLGDNPQFYRLALTNAAKAAVTISSGLTANNKTYDGTTAATLSSNAVVLNGVLPTDKTNVGLSTSGYVATFASPGAGTGISVTVSGLTLTGSAAGKYTLIQPTGLAANIAKAAVTISSGITANNKTYDGTTTATLSSNAVVLSGVLPVDRDSVGLSTNGYVANFASPGVGTKIPVTVSGLSLAGSAAGNYALVQPTGLTANITKGGN